MLILRSLAVLLCVAGAAAPASAELQSEDLNVVELKQRFQPHWVWVNDISFTRMADGRAYLIDADTGDFLGMVSGGYAHGTLQLLPDGTGMALPATFLSRGSRGERTDVVTFYDASTLAPGEDIEIPAKRFVAIPFLSSSPVTDDGRFSLVYNFTPEQSVTVVDLKERKFAGEFPTAGCALIYPTGPRSFFMQCGDGSLQSATIDEAGQITLAGISPRLFEDSDPATEKPVRIGTAQWLFFTIAGEVAVIDASGGTPVKSARWSLAGPEDSAWRIGGVQPAAYHQPSNRLFVLMHEGGEFTHKDPGTEIWVFDVAAQKRIARFPLEKPATSLAVSGDASPLLYAILFGEPELVVSDPDTGRKLRAVGELGHEMTVIQPAPIPGGTP